MNSIASKSPIVEDIVRRLIETFRTDELTRGRYVLNADLVPRVNEQHLMHRTNLQESQFKPLPPKVPRQEPLQIKTTVVETLSPSVSFKKIFPLLRDPFISHIESLGPNTPLTIVKSGNSQTTNIVMSKEEIQEFLNYLSERSRIPLVEGVFRAMVDNLLVNAVVSDYIDPKFIIKKGFPGI